MGCDIHFFVEKKVSGKWESADKWSKDDDGEERGIELQMVDYDDRFYRGRNYELFCILAGVRGEMEPISEPKGIPDDSCQEIKDQVQRWHGDGHSHSHFTVEELISFDWTKTSKLDGLMNALEFQKWNRYGRKHQEGPDSYCGGVFGQNTRVVSMEEMEKILSEMDEFIKTSELSEEEKKAHIKKVVDGLYCEAEWELPYYKMCRDLFSNTLPKLLALGKPSDVRIVFFFDN